MADPDFCMVRSVEFHLGVVSQMDYPRHNAFDDVKIGQQSHQKGVGAN